MMMAGKERREEKREEREYYGLGFSLGGSGHPPTVIYHFFSRPKETVFTEKLHPSGS